MKSPQVELNTILYVLLISSIIITKKVNAFIANFALPPANQYITCDTSSAIFSSIETEVEMLLRKARELRAEAENEANVLHDNLMEKKSKENAKIDAIINDIFRDSQDISFVAKKLKEGKHSTPTLLCVVERLHERELYAKGVEHVEHVDHSFNRVSTHNANELAEVSGLVDQLINAAELLDDEYAKEQIRNSDTRAKYVDSSHWTSGELSSVLRERQHFLGREHDEQFKNRLEEFYEAARRKKE